MFGRTYTLEEAVDLLSDIYQKSPEKGIVSIPTTFITDIVVHDDFWEE